MLALNVIGLLCAIPRYFGPFPAWGNGMPWPLSEIFNALHNMYDGTHPGTIVMNVLWTLFNMVILGVAAAVANEQQQRRNSVRIPARIPVRLLLPNGTVASGMTTDMSVGGASLTCSESDLFTRGDSIRLSFPAQTGDADAGLAPFLQPVVEHRLVE